MSKLEQQSLALAGILQASTLVHNLALSGYCDSGNYNASLNSLFIDSTNVDEVFGSTKDLSTGLQTLKNMSSKKHAEIKRIIFYSIALINLEKKIMKNKDFISNITSEIASIKKEEFFPINHANSIAKLAELYKITAGKLNPTIMVSGKQIYLSNKHIANNIRVLLLSGIRAASLWKAQGGKTWQLMINKKKMFKFVNSLSI